MNGKLIKCLANLIQGHFSKSHDLTYYNHSIIITRGANFPTACQPYNPFTAGVQKSKHQKFTLLNTEFPSNVKPFFWLILSNSVRIWVDFFHDVGINNVSMDFIILGTKSFILNLITKISSIPTQSSLPKKWILMKEIDNRTICPRFINCTVFKLWFRARYKPFKFQTQFRV